ncbi:HYC_CC_PP family protein [Yeosuana marina]|uniref:HYC_CC_PP family protein n=1 Tax=Yeosuana marina TaxID=1565536 RepID=UPI0030C827E2
MKSFFSKILSFLLAALILLTTSSFRVNIHYCGDELVSMALFGKAKICTDKIEKNDFSIKNCSALHEKDCCDSQTIVKQTDNVFETSKSELDVQTIVFLNSLYYTYQNLFAGKEKNIVSFDNYRPPLLTKDVQILHETYLI